MENLTGKIVSVETWDKLIKIEFEETKNYYFVEITFNNDLFDDYQGVLRLLAFLSFYDIRSLSYQYFEDNNILYLDYNNTSYKFKVKDFSIYDL